MIPQSTRLIGALAVYNVVQNRWLNRRAYVAANVVVTAVMVSWARRSGVDRDQMGLSPDGLVRGLATGVGVAAAGAGLAIVGRDSCIARVALADARLDEVGRGEAIRRVLIRFPLGTALFEEVIFRGVLPATMTKPTWQADLISNGAFAAWHLIPTSHAIAANEKARGLPPSRRTALVVGGSTAAGVAGLLLSVVRRATGSLTAPWVIHAVANGVAFGVALRSSAGRGARVRMRTPLCA